MAEADLVSLRELVRPLGLHNKRSLALKRFSSDYLNFDPENGDPIHLYGIGKYARDAFMIFIRGDVTVKPTDGELKSYLRRRTSGCDATPTPAPTNVGKRTSRFNQARYLLSARGLATPDSRHPLIITCDNVSDFLEVYSSRRKQEETMREMAHLFPGSYVNLAEFRHRFGQLNTGTLASVLNQTDYPGLREGKPRRLQAPGVPLRCPRTSINDAIFDRIKVDAIEDNIIGGDEVIGDEVIDDDVIADDDM